MKKDKQENPTNDNKNNKRYLIVIIFIVFAILLTITSIIISIKDYDTIIKANYGVNIPNADKVLYEFDSGGRDGDNYSVNEYNKNQLDKIKNLNWQGTLEYQTINQDLKEFLEKYKVPKKYYPTYDKNSKYLIKTFSDKRDYLLVIYNTKNNLTYIYQFHL